MNLETRFVVAHNHPITACYRHEYTAGFGIERAIYQRQQWALYRLAIYQRAAKP